ncbi:MAG: hypothetical protein EON52_03070 [Actinomycetales bacterium]|nr:MAG: hypothetical protein EON52_03070 [Actinomycetales bacterium]
MVTAAASLRRVIAALAVGGVLVAAPMSSQADEADNPGLPRLPCSPQQVQDGFCTSDGNAFERNANNWLNNAQNGLTGSVRAKQWARLPLTMLASNVLFSNRPGDGSITNLFQYDSFFVSPKGSGHPYGDTALIPVRTVAFGSIPATVTLQVSQRRDADGLPVPVHLEAEQVDIAGPPAKTVLPPVVLDETVSVRVRSLSVDGVDVQLQKTCRTGTSARLRASSEATEYDAAAGSPDDQFDQAHGFFGLSGGTLNGTIDIPAFSGCTTATGDDVSPLLTSAISSTGNPLSITIGAVGCFSFTDTRPLPTQPGATTPEAANCFEGATTNPDTRTIPFPRDFPDFAPGEQPLD